MDRAQGHRIRRKARSGRTWHLCVVAASAAAVVVSGLIAGAGVPAAQALSSYNIVTKKIWRVGEPMPVRINSVYADSCMVWVVGPSATRVVTLRPKRYRINTILAMPSGPPGRYQVQVRCGREGARSEPFVLVGPSSPLQASCRILEQGISWSGRDRVTYGAVMVNDSPELAAVSVEISVVSIDASENVIQTATVDAWDIPPGGRILVGDSSVPMPYGTKRYETYTRCSTSMDPVLAPSAATGRAVSLEDGDLELAGAFVNTASYTVDDYSDVVFILRATDGKIRGGNIDSPDSFVGPGGTGTWRSFIFGFRGPWPISLESMVLLKRARSS